MSHGISTPTCDRCRSQSKDPDPHEDLKLISHVTELGDIYVCRTCQTYWERGVHGNWEIILNAELKIDDEASS